VFLETPRFPDTIAQGAEGGPEFVTDLIEFSSGHEQRHATQALPRRRYTVTLLNRRESDFEAVAALFRIAQGRAHGFRFRDWADYAVTTANGRLGTTAIGTGAPTYQFYRRYTVGASTQDQSVRKPTSGSATVYRNAAPVTVGAGAGEIAIDYTNGIVTFVPDVTKTITGITQANPGVVTATAHGYSNGDLIYIDGVGGMTQVNGVVFTIAGVTANTFQLGVNTTSYGAYTSGGNAKKFPQPADALTWAGEFDIAVRFDTDRMRASSVKRAGAGFAITWDAIALVELRT
jgi:uncharacterized protein (TIGR02217 family)